MSYDGKSNLSYNTLKYMYCHGGTDISGEWIPSVGNYYYYLENWIYNINHNYQVQIYKLNKNKWRLSIYLCLTACNSNNIKLYDGIHGTIKIAKQIAIDFVKEYDKSEKPLVDIEDWKGNHAKPVFTYENDELTLIGTTYNSVGNDKKTDNYFAYYNDDLPKYSYGYYYTLDKSWEKIFIWKYNLFGGGYSACGIKDETLLNRMIDMIKDIPKYNHFIEFINNK